MLRRRHPQPGDEWHLDDGFLRNQGKTHYLWRAVVQHGHVLRPHRLTADQHRATRNEAIRTWREVVSIAPAA